VEEGPKKLPLNRIPPNGSKIGRRREMNKKIVIGILTAAILMISSVAVLAF